MKRPDLKQRTSPRMPSDVFATGTKRNAYLYMDGELVEKLKSLGFNLGKKRK